MIRQDREKDRVHWRRTFFPGWIGFVPNQKALDRVKKRDKVEISNIGRQFARSCYIPANEDHPAMYLVWLNASQDKTNLANVVTLLAHETIHIFQWMMEAIDESSFGQETEAYFVQSVTMELYTDWKWHCKHSKRTPTYE